MRYLGKKSVAASLHTALNVLWYLFWVIGLSLVGWQLFAGFFAGSVLPDPPPASLHIETPGLDIDFGAVTTAAISRDLNLFTLFSIIPLFAVYLYVLYNLRRIFATLVAENPFARENVVRIRRIGGAVITGAVLKSLVQTAFGFFFTHYVSVTGVDFRAKLSLDLTTILLGLVILVLAEIFRLGSAMQEEQDLTV
jgi:hypothetical protein